MLGAWFPNMPMLPERVKRLREVGTVLLNGIQTLSMWHNTNTIYVHLSLAGCRITKFIFVFTVLTLFVVFV